MGMLPYYGVMELHYHSMSGFPNCGRFAVYNGPYMETEYQLFEAHFLIDFSVLEKLSYMA